MNLNKIVHSLHMLDLQEQKINQRYWSKNQDMLSQKDIDRRGMLHQDEVQDLRIYGFTQDDIKAKFKNRNRYSSHDGKSDNTGSDIGRALSAKQVRNQRPRTSMTQGLRKRPSTNLLESYMTINGHENKRMFSSDKQPINFTNLKDNVVRNNKIIRKKSIARFRRQFNNNFEEDLKQVQIFKLKQRTETKPKTVVIETKTNEQFYQPKEEDVTTFFELTQKIYTKPDIGRLACNKKPAPEQLANLNYLNQLIFDIYPTYFLGKLRRNHARNWNQCWKNIPQLEQAGSYRFYLVSMNNLDVWEVRLSDMPHMHLLVGNLVKSEKMLHFHIVKQDEQPKLVYEQFIASPAYALHHFQWPIWLFRYYFKRLMLMGQTYSSVDAINQQQSLFYQNYNKIPRKVFRFIFELKQKSYNFIDHKHNKRSGNLGQLLEEGYKEAEQRVLCWNKKATKFVRNGKQNKVQK